MVRLCGPCICLFPPVLFAISRRLSFSRSSRDVEKGMSARMSERDLGPRLMTSNTLNSSFGPSYSGFREIRQLLVKLVHFGSFLYLELSRLRDLVPDRVSLLRAHQALSVSLCLSQHGI